MTFHVHVYVVFSRHVRGCFPMPVVLDDLQHFILFTVQDEATRPQFQPSGKPLPSSPFGSVFGWVKSKLGFGGRQDPEPPKQVDAEAEEVVDEIGAVSLAAWSRPSHEFRVGRTTRNQLGSAELLRTSSEPAIPRRRRHAREFKRNLSFYKDMAGEYQKILW